MKKIDRIAFVITALFLGSELSLAGGDECDSLSDLQASIVISGEAIEASIHNSGWAVVEIFKNFEVGGKNSLSNTRFRVRDTNELEYQVNGVINSSVPRAVLKLYPQYSYGKSFKLDLLKLYFDLPMGDYQVMFEYVGAYGVDSKQCDQNVSSKWIDMTIG